MPGSSPDAGSVLAGAEAAVRRSRELAEAARVMRLRAEIERRQIAEMVAAVERARRLLEGGLG